MGNQSSSNVNYTSQYSSERSYNTLIIDRCAPFTKSPIDELRRGYSNGKRMFRPRLLTPIINMRSRNIQQITKPETTETKTDNPVTKMEIPITKTESDPINITTDNIQTNKPNFF
jgi:hypothetical protein